MRKIKLSVHQLVDFILRTGDIDNRVFNASTMQEGSFLHSQYQALQDLTYLSEYFLKHTFEMEDFSITIEGKADGIITKNNEYTIEEIKTTIDDLLLFHTQNEKWHLGQAKCYALMFVYERKLSSINIKLTYFKQGNTKEKYSVDYSFSKDDLEKDVYSYIKEYIDFQKIIIDKEYTKLASINDLKFPYSSYRPGQKELIKYCYNLTKKGGRFFVEAPTGIGKTISTLFPFIKALKDNPSSKIFYLTAKSSGKKSCEDTVEILKSNGLIIDSITITSKKKICPNPECGCNPDECIYAKGYYDKIRKVIQQCLLANLDFNFDSILKIAIDNTICPFEFQLDLSLFMDIIICDYNYLFDPIGYLKRFFDEGIDNNFMVLIDEAHNLVDRSKDMYSATINYNTYLDAYNENRYQSNTKVKKALAKVKKVFSIIKVVLGSEERIVLPTFDGEIISKLQSFLEIINDVNKNEHASMSQKITDLYMEINRFIKLLDFLSEENYLFYFENDNGNYSYHHFCLNASKFLQNITDNNACNVFFSATLSPTTYFIDSLGGVKESDPFLCLPSPFPKDNLKVLMAPKISLKYKKRDATLPMVISFIKEFVSHKIGNYLIFVPSYEYLHKIEREQIFDDTFNVVFQFEDMDDYQKNKFLENFAPFPNKTTVGFAIIGGSFSEGIDLVSDRLIGVCIVGIGLKKICFENDCISSYYKSLGCNGFDYSYLYPGINKIMQAAGRVIRSETDKGAILLIDERYAQRHLSFLFERIWPQYDVVYDTNDIKESLIKFFGK